MKTNRGKAYFYWRGRLDAGIPWLNQEFKGWPDWAVRAYCAGLDDQTRSGAGT